MKSANCTGYVFNKKMQWLEKLEQNGARECSLPVFFLILEDVSTTAGSLLLR